MFIPGGQPVFRSQARGAAGVFITDKTLNNVEYKSKMQCFIPVEVREAIDTLQQEMRLKGISRRESSLSRIFIALVEEGIKAYEQPGADPVAPNHAFGPKTINIPLPRELRIKVAQISAGAEKPNREMVNILAWWGVEAFTQYVHALAYAEPKAKQERKGRKAKTELQNT